VELDLAHTDALGRAALAIAAAVADRHVHRLRRDSSGA
jgi:hypothetical protein